MEKRVIITFHGLEVPASNGFDSFVEFSNGKSKNDIVLFFYYTNEKNSVKRKSFDIEVEKVLDKYKDYKMTFVAYSFGAAIAAKHASKNKNVEKIIMICPTFKVSFWSWVSKLWNNIWTRRRLVKKLGKERFAQLNNKIITKEMTVDSPNVDNPGKVIRFDKKSTEYNTTRNYPIKLAWNIYRYRSLAIKNLKKIVNKDIVIINSLNDTVVQNTKNMSLIKKKLSETNNVSTFWDESSHYEILKKNEKIFNIILEQINTNKTKSDVNTIEIKTKKGIENLPLIDFKEYHKMITDVYKKYADFISSKSANWYANAGTIIGAHLYKGIIPWDDDMDMLIEYNEYKKIQKDLSEFSKSISDWQLKSTFDNKKYIKDAIKIESKNKYVLNYRNELYIVRPFIDLVITTKNNFSKFERFNLFIACSIMFGSSMYDNFRGFEIYYQKNNQIAINPTFLKFVSFVVKISMLDKISRKYYIRKLSSQKNISNFERPIDQDCLSDDIQYDTSNFIISEFVDTTINLPKNYEEILDNKYSKKWRTPLSEKDRNIRHFIRIKRNKNE